MQKESNVMKRVLACSLFAVLLLGACAIPGVGPYASQVVDLFIGTRFTNPHEPKRNSASGSFYGNVYKGGTWIYRTDQEGPGIRYYIRFYYERCKYSLYVDENDIIRSWRDEGGTSHMSRCLLR
jgi:hypothetical protein